MNFDRLRDKIKAGELFIEQTPNFPFILWYKEKANTPEHTCSDFFSACISCTRGASSSCAYSACTHACTGRNT
ncbi:MAG: hypothetical protein ACTTI3_04170 [Treponema sp.]